MLWPNMPFGRNNMFFGYVKKEDAKFLLKFMKYSPMAISFAFFILFLILNFNIFPKLMKMYEEVGYQLPMFLQARSFIMGVALFLLILIGLSDKTEEKMKKELKKYKKGEMILIRKLVDRSTEWKVLGVVSFTVGYIILSVVLPISRITSSF